MNRKRRQGGSHPPGFLQQRRVGPVLRPGLLSELELFDVLPISSSIFKAYDIRGVVGKTLDIGIARHIGQAFGTAADAGGGLNRLGC